MRRNLLKLESMDFGEMILQGGGRAVVLKDLVAVLALAALVAGVGEEMVPNVGPFLAFHPLVFLFFGHLF